MPQPSRQTAITAAILLLLVLGVYALSKMQARIDFLERQVHEMLWQDTQERLDALRKPRNG